MPDLILRTVLTFAFDDEKWFVDKKRVTGVIDAVGASDLGPAITHAGGYGEQRPAKGAAAIAKAVAKGKTGSFLLLDAADEVGATIHVAIDVDTDSLDVTLMIKGAALTSRRRTILDTLEEVGAKVFAAVRDQGTLSKGFCHPMAEQVYTYPRARPIANHPRLETSAVIDFLDSRADDAESKALLGAKTPPYVKRKKHGDLIALRWVGDATSEDALALAAGRHERWMSKTITLRPVGGASDQAADELVPVSRKAPRAPFTFFDPDSGFAYKAIIVDPAGTPDADVWAEMTKALAKRGSDVKGIRLVAPLRQLAVKIAAKAAAAGFDAVVYPDKTDHLRKPGAGGLWIDEVDPEKG